MTEIKTSTNDKVFIVRNQFSREARVNVDEMRMQIQTQLDPNAVENLVFDSICETESGCDDLAMIVNLRTIS